MSRRVLLQRHLLHFCACSDRLLRHRLDKVGWYILPFAAGNFLGPLFRPSVRHPGRRAMISFTYVSGSARAVRISVLGRHVERGEPDRSAWMVIFFFASPAAAHLSDRQRNLSAGGAWKSRLRCSMRSERELAGSLAPRAVRRADRHRVADQRFRWLPARIRIDDRGTGIAWRYWSAPMPDAEIGCSAFAFVE